MLGYLNRAKISWAMGDWGAAPAAPSEYATAYRAPQTNYWGHVPPVPSVSAPYDLDLRFTSNAARMMAEIR